MSYKSNNRGLWYEPLRVNADKFEADEMDKFLRKYNLPEFIEILNCPTKSDN